VGLMAGFKFRLQTVYELRKHVEKEHKDQLSRERHTLIMLQETGKTLQTELERCSQKYMSCANEGMSPDEAVRMDSYIRDLNRLIVENEKSVVDQSVAVENARLALIEKMKDRKTLDSLYEKQSGSFFEDESRKTEKEIEEMISGRLALNNDMNSAF
jgi:flagellar FliJ protein